MKLFTTYLGSEHRHNIFGTIKQVTVVTLLVVFITILVGIWPGIVYKETAGYQFSDYDLHLNGPITGKTIKELSADLPEGVETLGLLSSASQVIVQETEARVHTTYYDSRSEGAFDIGPVNSDTLVAGDISSGLPALADVYTAKGLGIKIGDVFTLKGLGEDGTPDQIRAILLTGLIAPTTGITGLYLPADLSKLGAGDMGGDEVPIYSDLFVQSKPAGSLDLSSISQGTWSETVSLMTRPQELKSALAEVEASMPKRIRDVMIAASLLVLMVYLFREHSVRLDSRERQLAILSSLGMSRAAILRFFGAEQLLLAVIPVALGSFLGLSYLESVGIWLPRLTEYGVIGAVVGGFTMAVIVSLLGLRRKLARTDMARLLSAE